MDRLRRGIGWALVALGAVHVVATPVFMPGWNESAVWFASAGGALMLVGALNLLGPGSGVPPALCTAANLGTLLFALALLATAPEIRSTARTIPADAAEPQVWLVLALAAAGAWLSRAPSVSRKTRP